MTHMIERLDHRRTALVGLGLATFAAAVGIGLSATAVPLPGGEPLSVEDIVDTVAMLALGGLGVLLVHRRTAVGLGQALVLIAALEGANYLCSGLADAIAGGNSPPPAAQLLSLASSVLFILTFVLFFTAPLLLFPTGRLPSSRWRPVVVAAALGTVTSMVAMLLAPGLLDDDVPAWGTNPLGITALDGVLSAMQTVGFVLVVASVLASACAVIVRLVRYRGARRRQMWWFLLGAVPMVTGLMTDTDTSETASLVTALVIFGGLLGGMGWALLGSPGRRSELG